MILEVGFTACPSVSNFVYLQRTTSVILTSMFVFQRLVHSISKSAWGRNCIQISFSRCRAQTERHYKTDVASRYKVECV